MVQNNFKGNYAVKNNSIKVFRQDLIYGECSTETIGEGYQITIHTNKRELWSLRSMLGNIVGVGNPFSNTDYSDYLYEEYPVEVIDKLKIRFEQHEFSSDSPLMFALESTCRLIKGKEGSLYVGFPDNTCMIYDNGGVAEEIALSDGKFYSDKIGKWIEKQIDFIHKVEDRFRNHQIK